MLSSPMSHYMRHVLLSYREIAGLRKKLAANQELNLIKARLVKLKKEHPGHPKITAMLQQIKRMKDTML